MWQSQLPTGSRVLGGFDGKRCCTSRLLQPVVDRRTTRHPGYAASQRARKRIEEAFGWTKSIAGLCQTKLRGLAKVDWAFTFAAAAYDLVRLPKLVESA